MSLCAAVHKELHVFADASDVAIAAAAYLRLSNGDGQCQDVSFVMGKSKLAPIHATTIPRLELCAAVLAVEIFEIIRDEIDIELNSVSFYSDSKVVLGYIRNETKRFYVYVSNRVERIRISTMPDQWRYVRTDLNRQTMPRASFGADLDGTTWLQVRVPER
ncbi:PREDICTED: uncharacterized protein LOC106812932 [Priapulus caudatus]|uniref:Uncharacterized protein LOC106812932 n=1 Tax=Priapulus caudatus TaxID=37621 RepID=A0ABM1EJQ6_PRICU|nr:PREDICTED: uncharacterized protein LOC106812932 [Priapulus caudatus]